VIIAKTNNLLTLVYIFTGWWKCCGIESGDLDMSWMLDHLWCRFTDCKPHSIDSLQDAAVVLRTIAGQKLNKILLREYRPHLLASSLTYEPNPGEEVINCDDIITLSLL